MKNTYVLLLTLLSVAVGCSSGSGQSAEQDASPAAVPDVPTEKQWMEEDRQFLLAELDRTTKALRRAVEDLGEDQWTFQENDLRWNIAEIVEHLTVHNELLYREITALANLPEMPQYLAVTTGQDEYFQTYANAPDNAQAKWYLQPIGRFGSQRHAIDGFRRVRDGLRDYVEATDVDLRKHFSFRPGAAAKPLPELLPGDVIDLHQLLLLGIAHTDRHLRQIRNLKGHPKYPRVI